MDTQEKYFKIILRHKTSLIVFGITMLLACVSYGLLFSSIREKEKNISVLLGTIEVETKKSLALKSFSAVIETTREERDMLRARLLHSKDVVSLIEEIETLGEERGLLVRFDHVDVKNGESEDAPYLSMGIHVEGDARAITEFLSLLELLPHALSFEKVFIDQVSEGNSWEGDITVYLFNFTPTPVFSMHEVRREAPSQKQVWGFTQEI